MGNKNNTKTILKQKLVTLFYQGIIIFGLFKLYEYIKADSGDVLSAYLCLLGAGALTIQAIFDLLKKN